MYDHTYANCSNLESVHDIYLINEYSKWYSADYTKYTYLFYGTFEGCVSLKDTPSLEYDETHQESTYCFKPAAHMFDSMFKNSGITSMPDL